MHTPLLASRAQDSQIPSQAVEQQTPWAQTPELQSVSVAQTLPTGFSPQLPALHVLGESQSASELQVVLQRPPTSHVNGAQDSLCPIEQAPSPSQRPAEVRLWPLHTGGWQTTPATYISHDPVPSQKPSFPQVDGSVCAQSWRGSVATSAGRHWPILAMDAQVRHGPEQSVAQQTSSKQNPEAH